HAAMTEQRARAFEKDERFFLRIERQFLRMVCIVQPEGDDGSHLERRQPHDLGTGDEAAVVEQQFLGGVLQSFRFANWNRGMDPARKCDAGAHHRAPVTNALDNVPSASATMSTHWPARTRGAGRATPSAS